MTEVTTATGDVFPVGTCDKCGETDVVSEKLCPLYLELYNTKHVCTCCRHCRHECHEDI